MSSAPRALRRLLTPLWLAFTLLVIAVAAACLWLGWWQWHRFEGLGGTFQNLGYTIQWPFFAAFAVYIWWRLLKDASTPHDDADAETDVVFSVRQKAPVSRLRQGVPDSRLRQGADETPAGAESAEVLPAAAAIDDDDPELAAYNRYLAGLNTRAQTQVKERA